MFLFLGEVELIAWVITHPEVGWVLAIGYLIFEIRTPWGKIQELMQMIKNVVTVVRAMARTDSNIDTDGVDEYLLENGVEPADFIVEEDEDSQAILNSLERGDD